MTKTIIEQRSFEDAFGETVCKGDTVVYVAGDRSRRHLKKGVVESIALHIHEWASYSGRPYKTERWQIRVRFAPKSKSKYGTVSSGVSPLEHPERIMKLESGTT